MFSIFILIILVALFPRILNLFTKDIASINDSDLSLRIISVSDEKNAYFDLIKIEEVVYEPEGKTKEIKDMIDNKMWNEELAKEIIFNNQEAFDFFSVAVRKPNYQYPLLADPKNINSRMILPSLNSWRIISGYSSIKALYLSKQEKKKEAIEEALSSVYVAQKMQESQVSLIEYLVAMDMKKRGFKTIQSIITSSNLNNSELKKYALDMDQFYKNEDGLIAIIKCEYHIRSLTIDALANGDTEMFPSFTEEESHGISKKLNNNYYFRPNKTKDLFASYARKNIENTNKFYNNIENIDIQTQAPSSFIEIYLSENIIGKTLYDITATGLSSMNTKKCNEDSLVSATQTMIAMKAYKNDNGDLPNSLEQLVPDYLSSVPLDYFDGNSLRYSKEDKILYSIGKNLKDNGGSRVDDRHTMSDLTWKINF